MSTPQDANEPSFICYNCNTENFYNPKDYIGKGTMLMEMIILGPKKKDVIIECKNRSCKKDNTVTIEYW